MTKDEIITKLIEKEIDHDPNALKADLEALLPLDEGGTEAKAPSTFEAGVTVRITKAGHGKVHTGLSEGKVTYNMDDMVALPLSVAQRLEERHYAEIRE